MNACGLFQAAVCLVLLFFHFSAATRFQTQPSNSSTFCFWTKSISNGRTSYMFLHRTPSRSGETSLVLFDSIWTKDNTLVDCVTSSNQVVTKSYVSQCWEPGATNFSRNPDERFNVSRLVDPVGPCEGTVGRLAHPRQSVRRRSRDLESVDRQDGQTLSGESSGQKPRRSKRAWIVPGTLWCGAGHSALDFADLGMYVNTDMCCREHDHCKDSITSFGFNYGVLNTNLFTLSHCDCDKKFRQCLHKANDSMANVVGYGYFNVLKMRCFEFAERMECAERTWWGMCKFHQMAKYALVRDATYYNSTSPELEEETSTVNTTSAGQPTATPDSTLPSTLPTEDPHIDQEQPETTDSPQTKPTDLTPTNLKPTELTPTKPTDTTPTKPTELTPTKPTELTPTKPTRTPSKPTDTKPTNTTDTKPTDTTPTKPTELTPTKPTDTKPTELTPTKPTPTKPTDSTPTDTKPTESTPTPTELTPTKPTELTPTKPTESKPTDSKPTDTKPTDSTPTDSKPTDSTPTDSKPTDTKPTPTKPTDTKPTPTKPTDSTPTDSKPTDTKATPTKPTDSTPTKPTDTKPTPTESTPTKPTDTNSTESKPTDTTPTKPTELTPTKPTDLKPTDTKPTDSTPTDSKPTDTKPTPTKPTESTPTKQTDTNQTDTTDTNSTESKPTESTPTKPTELTPTHLKPTDTKPTETKSTESTPTKPTDSKPTDTKPTELTPTKPTQTSSSPKTQPDLQRRDKGKVSTCESYKDLDSCRLQIPGKQEKFGLRNAEFATLYHCNCTARLANQFSGLDRIDDVHFFLLDFVSQFCFILPPNCTDSESCSSKDPPLIRRWTKDVAGGRPLVASKRKAKRLNSKRSKRKDSFRLYKKCLRMHSKLQRPKEPTDPKLQNPSGPAEPIKQ